MVLLYRVSAARIDEGVDMSILGKLRTTRSHSTRSTGTGRRTSRDLARALASAPTRSSREELLQLQNMGR